MAPVSKHVQGRGMATCPTSAFITPYRTRCSSLLNDLFALGPLSKSVVPPAAKEILLNFKSDHVILHKTLVGSRYTFVQGTPSL